MLSSDFSLESDIINSTSQERTKLKSEMVKTNRK